MTESKQPDDFDHLLKEANRKKLDTRSIFEKLSDSFKNYFKSSQLKKALDNPTDTFNDVLRSGAKTATKVAMKAGEAVFEGIGEAISDEPTASTTASVQKPTNIKNNKSWLQNKYEQLETDASKTADSKIPLRWRFVFFIVHQLKSYMDWATLTFPYIFRPICKLAIIMRNGLDKKILSQGRSSTGMQRLKRRILSFGPSKSFMAKCVYFCVNTMTICTLISFITVGLLYGTYSYATYHEYKQVYITNVFRAPDKQDYMAEVHGYQILPDNTRQTTFFEITWNPFYLQFFPQYMVSDISINDVCDIKTYGALVHLPISFRKLLNLNPVIISTKCVRTAGTTNAKSSN